MQDKFLASEYPQSEPALAGFHIIPVPLEQSVSYGGGTANGPQALLAAGWSAEQKRGVLEGWAEVGFALPVPRPRASLSAREAFLYLVLFATLAQTARNTAQRTVTAELGPLPATLVRFLYGLPFAGQPALPQQLFRVR